MRISDWSSDVCSSDLRQRQRLAALVFDGAIDERGEQLAVGHAYWLAGTQSPARAAAAQVLVIRHRVPGLHAAPRFGRSEERRVGKEGVSTWRSRGSPAH